MDSGHPVRPVRVTAGIDFRDEILVAGKNHDQDQIAGEGDVDQAENAEDNVGLPGARRVDDELPQQHAELEQQHREADDEAEIKRRYQPAAVEDQDFYQEFDALEGRVGTMRSRLFAHLVSAPIVRLTPPFSWR